MNLNTISKLEQFITDALLSSEVVPLGVNVVRLAATTDEEGIASLARSVVVRYVNSSCTVTQKHPLVIERTLTFEVIHSAQSYLSESGHDYATQMCQAAYLTLNNTVPSNAGVQVDVPFHMISESFNGITDSSHYVYTQTWQLEVQEVNRTIALDPCVAAGNCSYLFPSKALGSILPGDVIEGNRLWSPVLPPPTPGEDYDSTLCGVEVRGDDLVYTHDTSVVFLYNWKQYDLRSTRIWTDDDLLNCNIYLKDTGELFDRYFASNCDNRMLIDIGGRVGGNDGESLNGLLQGKSTYGFSTETPTTIYVDPTDPDAVTDHIRYGTYFRVDLTYFLEVETIKYYRIQLPQYGRIWIAETDVYLFDPDFLNPILDCSIDELNPPLESCE